MPSPVAVSVDQKTSRVAEVPSFGERIVHPKFDPAACDRTVASRPEKVTVVVPEAATVNVELPTAEPMLLETEYAALLGVPVAAQPQAPTVEHVANAQPPALCPSATLVAVPSLHEPLVNGYRFRVVDVPLPRRPEIESDAAVATDFVGSCVRSKWSKGRATPLEALPDSPTHSSCPLPKSFVGAAE